MSTYIIENTNNHTINYIYINILILNAFKCVYRRIKIGQSKHLMAPCFWTPYTIARNVFILYNIYNLKVDKNLVL